MHCKMEANEVEHKDRYIIHFNNLLDKGAVYRQRFESTALVNFLYLCHNVKRHKTITESSGEIY